ncbi:hypothetical protein GCM10028778_12010 [Barrientosiimonas marina]|uniref:Sec-independent protein translocase protein TatA n=1 Tax=Lentibacillus kimchii TaxID=1542911 RepID=A0ABW2UX01_9BACI
MGIGSIGIPGLVLIVVLALIIFGPKKLPQIGKAAGETLHEFKSSANDLVNDDTDSSTKQDTEENMADNQTSDKHEER